MAIIKLVIAFLLSLTQIISPYLAAKNSNDYHDFYEKWSENQVYTEDYAVTLEKQPGKDFVVLNFADIQLNNVEAYGKNGRIAEKTIKKAIEDIKPDLITLTGDNSWSQMGYIRFVQVIDSYGIPWAPVMGNHDGENGDWKEENWCALQFANTENCLFKYGPDGMGIGNYVINIKENGKIIHSIYMLDTHTSTSLPCGGYDHLWDNQLKWYEWAVKGTNALAGETVESSIFFHIPCIQYRDAWAAAQYDEASGTFKNPDYADSFGGKEEGICSPDYDSGFFALVKELGSTKNMIAGHDHVNDFSIMYEGVRLSYSLKCGPGCYWNPAKNGGSTLTIDSDGHGTFGHYYIDPTDF